MQDQNIVFAEEQSSPALLGDSLSVQYIGSGSNHSCGLKADNSIVCWGYNFYGQLDVPDPNSNFKQLSIGTYHSCGLKNDGSIICWGYNSDGQSIEPSPNTGFRQVSAGASHTCGLKTDGSLSCWGSNSDGESTVPATNSNFVQVSTGSDHTCGLKSDGSIVCWGSNLLSKATVPAPNTDFTQVDAGIDHTCGLKNDNSLVCWGRNTNGQTNIPAPNSDFSLVSAGRSHTCARKNDSSIRCWGLNTDGQSTVPAPNNNFARLSTGGFHTCGLKSDGSFICWGDDDYGQVDPNFFWSISAGGNHTCGIRKAGNITCWGSNVVNQLDVPSRNDDFLRVSAGFDHTCGVKNDGSIVCWGGYFLIDYGTVPIPNSNYEEVSAGTLFTSALKDDGTAVNWPNAYIWELPGPLSGYRDVSAGHNVTCGVTTANELNCWGLAAPSPNISYISTSAGNSFACGTKFGGVLDCWGINTSGQTDAPSPSGNYGVVSSGDAHACGLLFVWPYSIACWGNNAFGQTTVPAPNSNFRGMDAGHNHTCAIRNDWSAACWGDNTDGKVTVPTLTSLKVPPVSQNPMAIPDSYTTLEDTTLVIDAAGGVLENDFDPDSPTLTAIKDSDPGLGTMALASDGSFTFTPTGDECGPDSFTYHASDGVNTSNTATVSLTLTCVNDQPDFSASDPPAITEDDPLQTIVGWAAFDPGATNESGQSVQTYTVSNISNPGLFSQAPGVNQSGTLTYQPAADQNGSSTFDILVQDDGGTPDGGVDTGPIHTFTITVNPINDRPDFSASNPPAVNEEVALQTIVGWANFTSPGPADEAAQTVQSYIVSNISNPGLFSQVPAVSISGTLTYQPTPDQYGSSTFNVQVQDDGGTANGGVDISAAQTFTITVNPINDQPDFSASDPPAVIEDAGLQTIASWATFDPGSVNEAGQSVQLFTVSNISNPGLFSQAPAVSQAGTLSYQPALNQNGSSTFDVQVQDDGGTTSGGIDTGPIHTFTIQVSPDNDQPTTPGLGVFNIVEDTPGNLLDIWPDFDDLEDTDLQLSFSLESYTNPGLFILIDISQDQYLRMAYTPDEFGSSTITVRATDTGGLFVESDLALTLSPVNDAPSFTPGGNVNVPMNSDPYSAAWASSISAGPSNESGQTLTFTISNNNNGLFTAQPDLSLAGVLSFTPVAGVTGSAQVSVALSDDGGTADGGADTSPTEIFTITLSPFPIVIMVRAKGGPGIFPGATVIDWIDDFSFQFDLALDNPPGNTDPDDANNPANYLLVHTGPNGILETASCIGAPGGDDILIPVNWVGYPYVGNTARVFINSGIPLPNGEYRIFACGSTSLTAGGIALAGDGVNSGTDYSLDFYVNRPDRLPDTGFPPGKVTLLDLEDYLDPMTSNTGLVLEIPRLDLSSPITGIPFQESNWNVSWLSNQVGWLEGTAFPTWAGNSVLTAHIVNRNGLPGPFKDLNFLRYGDQIVVSGWGQNYIYEVRSVKTLAPDDLSAALGHEEYPWITLVTCSGYLPYQEIYSSRIVVKAVQVGIK
jgi:LPXTG-site transpeptidase (sortase) family protein